MTKDTTNKGFWERFAKIYTGFMAKNDAAYEAICERLKPYIDNGKKVIWLMETVGFKTYHKWQKDEFAEYVSERGFHILDASFVKGKPLWECVLVAARITGKES